MAYRIITERSKTRLPDLWGEIYYSHIFGCFSRRDQATEYSDFDAAQVKVKQLRAAGYAFVSAIPSPGTT